MDFEHYLPNGKFNCKNLVSLNNVDQTDIFEILHRAFHLKTAETVGEVNKSLSNKKIVLITNKRLGLQQVVFRLSVDGANGNPMTIPLSGTGIEELLSGREYVEILSRLNIHAFVVGTSVCDDAEVLSKHLNTPVVNAYSGDSPCMACTHLMSILEAQKKLCGLNVCYVGCPTKVTSLISGMAKCGMNITFVTPKPYVPCEQVLNYVNELSCATYQEDLLTPLKTCDVLYVNNDFEEYKITKEVLNYLKPSASVLHDIPLTNASDADLDIMDDKRCLVATCGANMVFVQTAILELLLGK